MAQPPRPPRPPQPPGGGAAPPRPPPQPPVVQPGPQRAGDGSATPPTNNGSTPYFQDLTQITRVLPSNFDLVPSLSKISQSVPYVLSGGKLR